VVLARAVGWVVASSRHKGLRKIAPSDADMEA